MTPKTLAASPATRALAVLTVLLLSLGLLAGPGASPAHAASTLTPTGTTLTSLRANTTGTLTGLTVSGAEPSETISATLSTDVGTVAIATTTNLTLAFGNQWTGTSSITFTGVQDDVNAGLASATLSAGNTAGSTAHVKLAVSPAVPGYHYLSSNNHFYEYVPANEIAWTSADSAARARTFQGQPGYLATIPSATVNDFISTKIPNAFNIWFGARSYQYNAHPSLATVNGVAYARVWRWTAGSGQSPIASRVISVCPSYTGSNCFPPPGGAYSSWAGGEPNNFNYTSCSFCSDRYTGEWAPVTNWAGTLGSWNDLPGGRSVGGPSGYLVEYGDGTPSGGFTSVSSATSSVLITDVPSAPVVGAAPGDTIARLSFNAPTSPNSAITGYEVSTDGGSSWTDLTTSGTAPVTAEVAGLSNGTAYSLAVRAFNGVGTGAASNVVSVTPRGVPFAPTVSGRTGDRAVALSFPVPNDNGAAITSYDVSVDNGATWDALGTLGSGPVTGKVTGLVNGTTYLVRVRGRNVAGPGAPSTALELTPTSVPAAPVITATAGERSIKLSFAPPADNGSAISGYEVSVDDRETWSDLAVSGTDVLQGTVTGLSGGTMYLVAVRAVNFEGPGAASRATSVTPYSIPGAPALTVTPGDSSLALSIVPPADNGADITGYQVSLDGGSTWSALETQGESPLTATLTGLANGTTYQVAVRALSAPADGVSSGAQAVTPAAVPGAPGELLVTAAPAALGLSVTPAADNGSAITGYEVSLDAGETWAPVELSGSEDDPSRLHGAVSDLGNGTAYSVRVRALNLVGAGTATDTVVATPIAVPDAPLVTATAGPGSIELSFVRPADNGTAITGYEVSTDGGSTWADLTTSGEQSRTATLTGLTNGTTYDVSVRALNAAGPGAGSVVSSVTPAASPEQLQDVTVTAGNASLQVSFAPGADNGSAITGYQISLDDGDSWQALDATRVDEESSLLTATVTELENGTTYPVRLRAVNEAGAGAASDTFETTPFTVPSAPEVTATSGDQLINLSFGPPAGNGSAITGYEVSTDGGDTWSALAPEGESALMATVTELTNGTNYAVAVRAINAAGAGAGSTPVTVTPAAAPSAPEVTGSLDDRTLTLSFAPPQTDGTPVTGYEVSLDGGSTWQSLDVTASEGSELLTGTVTDLVYGKTHDVSVRATSAAGPGAASAGQQVVPVSAPAAPAVTAVRGDRSIAVSFAPPAANGSAISGYEASSDGGASWSPLATSGTSPLRGTLTGLVNGETYSVLVRATNQVGTGPASTPVAVTLVPVPGLPRNVKAVAGDRVLTVTAAAASPGGPAPYRYQVTINGGRTWVAVAATSSGNLSKRFEGLLNGTTYTVAVRFFDATGRSSQSPASKVLLPIWFRDAVSAADRAREIPVPSDPKAYRGPLAKTKAFNRTYAGALAIPLANVVGHQMQPKQAVTLEGLFGFNSSVLSSTARQRLAKLVPSLKYGKAIRCEGYADYAGSRANEFTLSQQRAAAVCSALRQLGARVTVSSVGYGPERAVIVGGTASQRAANRRVVVRFLS